MRSSSWIEAVPNPWPHAREVVVLGPVDAQWCQQYGRPDDLALPEVSMDAVSIRERGRPILEPIHLPPRLRVGAGEVRPTGRAAWQPSAQRRAQNRSRTCSVGFHGKTCASSLQAPFS